MVGCVCGLAEGSRGPAAGYTDRVAGESVAEGRRRDRVAKRWEGRIVRGLGDGEAPGRGGWA